MTFEQTRGRANGWAAQVLGRATEVSTNKAAPTPLPNWLSAGNRRSETEN